MSDDYKYKNLPRAANGIAPAQWDEKKKEWVPYDGINDVNIKNLKEVTDEINNIKVTQDKILERLDKPLDTQVTGSIVEKALEIKDRTWSGGDLIWGYISNNDDLDGPTSVRPVDVSGYRDKSIYIKNDYDVTLNSIRVYGLSEARNRGEDSISRDDYTLFYFDIDHEVDPGESLYITSDEYPGL